MTAQRQQQWRSWPSCRTKWKEWMAQRPAGRRLLCPGCGKLLVFGAGETRVVFWHEPPRCPSFQEVRDLLIERGELVEPDIDRKALLAALESIDGVRVFEVPA